MPPQISNIPESSYLATKKVVVFVDPYSTGCVVAQEMAKRGYLLIALWTKGFAEEMKSHIPASCGHMEYFAEITEASSLEETEKLLLEAAKGREIAACLAGGEAGVDFADAFSEYLGLLSNGTQIPNRRDKKIQQELIQKIGLRSVRQAGSDKFEDVEPFLKTEPYPIVLKPVESAGSDGVKLCYTFDEAKAHFELLMNSQMVNGGACPAVLCQEFLKGKEYVIDHVSRDGVHKTMMVWVYDKRHANGAAFVYFGMQPVDVSTPEAKILIAYTRRVLDALEIKHGPTHAEVMMTADGPCLVEMNCRAHGGDGNWRPLGRALTGGYSQVEATADAFLDSVAFRKLPDVPCTPFKASGQEVILVAFSRGKVKSTPGYDVIKQLPSFVCLESGIKQGSEVEYTVDLLTGIGSVIVMHKDPQVVARDIDFIRYMESINGLFVYETKLENLKRPHAEDVLLGQVSGKQHGGKPPRHQRIFSADGPSLIRHLSNDRPELRGPLVKRMTTVDSSKEAVIIVDPYSTGAVISEEIMKRGFSVIALWTLGFAPEMKTHVPISCGQLNYYDEIEEAASLDETMKVVYKAAGQLRVVACIAGGEAGVDLADALSEKMNVRTNGTGIPNRRDKKIQQELIKKHGLRSVRQAGGTKFEEVEKFLRTEPYPVVLKPTESAGSDGVKLCHSFEEAQEHFDVLMDSQMVNGGQCPAVLCQEFLRGKEYVVDHVSRDGQHKAVMVWVYDKRPMHGSAFVYFGCIPVDSESPEAKILIPYVRGVLDALEFKNGPSHAEVMMTPDGPCLVEMNCRAHGGDANWRPLCRALTGGYSQVEATVDCYLDVAEFTRLPSQPVSPFKASGQEAILVSCSRGVVKATPGFEEIKALPSFVYLETGVKPGTHVDYTIDLFTGIGSVILMHRDPEVLEKDVERIREMERENQLFVFEHQAGLLGSPSIMTFDVSSGPKHNISSDRAEMY